MAPKTPAIDWVYIVEPSAEKGLSKALLSFDAEKS